jgi:hypothetical protein
MAGSATLTTVSSMRTIDSAPVIVARIHHLRFSTVRRTIARPYPLHLASRVNQPGPAARHLWYVLIEMPDPPKRK